MEDQIEKLNQQLQDLRFKLSSTPILTPTADLPSVVNVTSAGLNGADAISQAFPSTARDDQASETSFGIASHLQDLAKTVSSDPTNHSKQVRYSGVSSGITLARLVMSAICLDGISQVPEQQDHQLSVSSSSLPITEASLPPRHAADHLINIYFEYRTPHLPIVDRHQVKEALDCTYSYIRTNDPRSYDRPAGIQIFTAFIVLAIALSDLPNPSNPASRTRPPQSEGCFLSALAWVDKVLTYSKSDLETLRVILLLAQFVALNPSRGSLWHLTGTALRFCVDIGIHWETDEQSLSIDPDVLLERRRLWYCTYQLDRLLCVTLGRPLGIVDESMRVPLPSPWVRNRSTREATEYDTHHHRAHNHLFGMSILESEIKQVQQNQSCIPKLSNPKTNYKAWFADILPRLNEWNDTVPRPDKAHPSSVFAIQAFWDSIYHNAILLLYRPSATTTQTVESMSVTFDSSCKLIDSIRILQREGRCESLWKTVHQLFLAGLGVVYGLWQFKEIRDRNPIKNSIATLQSCASTLAAMSETFPGASDCRNAFETLSSATIDLLVSNNAEEERQNRVNFEKQVGCLLYGLQPSGLVVDEHNMEDFSLSAMLSGDGFGFGEMLNSAAQWPEAMEVDFNNLGSGPLGQIEIDSYS